MAILDSCECSWTISLFGANSNNSIQRSHVISRQLQLASSMRYCLIGTTIPLLLFFFFCSFLCSLFVLFLVVYGLCRLETDHGKDVVSNFLSYLACSRRGLYPPLSPLLSLLSLPSPLLPSSLLPLPSFWFIFEAISYLDTELAPLLLKKKVEHKAWSSLFIVIEDLIFNSLGLLSFSNRGKGGERGRERGRGRETGERGRGGKVTQICY